MKCICLNKKTAKDIPFLDADMHTFIAEASIPSMREAEQVWMEAQLQKQILQ